MAEQTRRPPTNFRGRTFLAACALTLSTLATPAAWAASAAPLTMDSLMTQLAQVRKGEARFVEQRKVLQLDRTLESSGRLSFTAPDILVRETLKPRAEKLAVDGNVVTMTLGGRTRTAALDSVPEAQIMVEAIRGTLTGDKAVLEKHFQTQLGGSAERWTLELVPRSPQLRGQVARVTLTGRQAQLREMQMLMADGDETFVRIEPVTGR